MTLTLLSNDGSQDICTITKACSVDGCDRKPHASGWCTRHYQAWTRTGLDPFDFVRQTEMERFWQHFKVDPESGCWVWQGSTIRGGYAQFSWERNGVRDQRAYRFAYARLVEEVPPGMHTDHLCRNVLCVNPAHLEVVTMKENLFRTRIDRCKRGHEMAGANLMVTPAGNRRCRRCFNDHRRNKVSEQSRRPQAECPECGRSVGVRQTGNLYPHNCVTPLVVANDERCRHGHDLTAGNLYLSPSRARGCRECWRLASRRRYYQAKGTA